MNVETPGNSRVTKNKRGGGSRKLRKYGQSKGPKFTREAPEIKIKLKSNRERERE